MALKFLFKKGFHTQRKDVQEKVWKAEQSKQHEQQRIEELRKQLNEERDVEELRQQVNKFKGETGTNETGLNWMYQGPKNTLQKQQDAEDFLTGKKTIGNNGSSGSTTNTVEADFSAAKFASARLNAVTGGGVASFDTSTTTSTVVHRPILSESMKKQESFNLRQEDPLVAMQEAERKRREALLADPGVQERMRKRLLAEQQQQQQQQQQQLSLLSSGPTFLPSTVPSSTNRTAPTATVTTTIAPTIPSTSSTHVPEKSVHDDDQRKEQGDKEHSHHRGHHNHRHRKHSSNHEEARRSRSRSRERKHRHHRHHHRKHHRRHSSRSPSPRNDRRHSRSSRSSSSTSPSPSSRSSSPIRTHNTLPTTDHPKRPSRWEHPSSTEPLTTVPDTSSAFYGIYPSTKPSSSSVPGPSNTEPSTNTEATNDTNDTDSDDENTAKRTRKPLQYGLTRINQPSSNESHDEATNKGLSRHGPLGIPEHIVRAREEAMITRMNNTTTKGSLSTATLPVQPPPSSASNRALTAEEKERRLKEMMDTAHSREQYKHETIQRATQDRQEELYYPPPSSSSASSSHTSGSFLQATVKKVLQHKWER